MPSMISSSRLKAFQKPFLLTCLQNGMRTDGRDMADGRKIQFQFSFVDRGHAEVTIGSTRVLCCVSGEVVRPRPEHSSEGQVSFNIDLSPMANSDFDLRPTAGTPTHEKAAELSIMVESLLKKSRAIDTEALCVEGGAKVWYLNVELRVLDDDGNIKDATALAALAGLLHFRRKKELEYRGKNRNAERLPPAPLSIHHMPVLVTLCFVDDRGTMVVDPTREEEAISTGQISIAINQFRELCAVRKAGGVPISSEMLRYAIQIAEARGVAIVEQLISSLKAHDTERENRRNNIWKKYADTTPIPAPIEIKDENKSSTARSKKASLDLDGNDDIEALEVVVSTQTAKALKSKVKRKRRKLLKEAKKMKVVEEDLYYENCTESPISESAQTTSRKQLEIDEVKRQEIIVTKDETMQENQYDVAEDSAELFSQAVNRKEKKSKTKKK